LTVAAELLLTDGVAVPHSAITKKDSPRRRGLKQGFFMILLMLVLAPVLGLIFRFAFNMMPWPVGLVVFLLGGGGLLRIAYALMFESGQAIHEGSLAGGQTTNVLPAGNTPSYIPPPVRSGQWLDTNDLEPRSVTDATTRLLEKEEDT
jgi:hypothetical protein